MTDKPNDRDPRDIAEDISKFISSDTGVRALTALSGKYNELHQKAELDGQTNEERAWYIAQAKGVKYAIDYFVSRKQTLELGGYDKKPM